MVAVGKRLVELIINIYFVVAGSFAADGNLLQPTVCFQYTSHVTFVHVVNTHSLLHSTLHGSSVGARFVSSA